MVVLGLDVHKGTHTAVAVDEVGRKLGERLVRATDAGHGQLLHWARREFAGQSLLWAVEDCRHLTARLERALLDGGQRVVRVPPKLMAGARSSARTRGKSDPIDALAVARAALREPDLPVAELAGPAREVKWLVDHREDQVGERTRMINRLRWHLHELDPELNLPDRSLRHRNVLARIEVFLDTQPDTVQVGICRDLVADIGRLTARIDALEAQLTARMRAQAPRLLELPGCGPLTAAKLVAETANPARFRSESCFAMHAGVAPIPASSGKTDRHRLARGGNRQLNAALHRIAVTQTRLDGLGRTYYQRRRSDGDTSMEALRALKRRLARVVFTRLTPSQDATTGALPAAA
jgi:transposase